MEWLLRWWFSRLCKKGYHDFAPWIRNAETGVVSVVKCTRCPAERGERVR